MSIQHFTISRNDNVYEAFPDVALLPSGKLICTFAECTHHSDRSYTRIMLTDSLNRGRSWSPPRPLTPASNNFPFWNCPRITVLKDGRLVVLVDQLEAPENSAPIEGLKNVLFFSADSGSTWSEPIKTPALGIVPDKLLELEDGRWIISCHSRDPQTGFLVQRLWYSDNQGKVWQGPVSVGRKNGLNLCEASIVPIDNLTLVAFMRENSGQGWDCFKTISHDRGESWSDPIPFPLPACHRPAAGVLQDRRILITHRFMQGGQGWIGWWTQNLFAALTDSNSALAETRNDAHTRILPIDFDRSAQSDTGYSGWVQFPDGEIYIVNYIMDDAPKAQIRGYSLHLEDFIIPVSHQTTLPRTVE